MKGRKKMETFNWNTAQRYFFAFAFPRLLCC